MLPSFQLLEAAAFLGSWPPSPIFKASRGRSGPLLRVFSVIASLSDPRSSTLMTHAISLGLSNLIIQDNLLISVSITLMTSAEPPLPCKVPGIRVWTSLGGHYTAYHSDLGKNLPSDCEE